MDGLGKWVVPIAVIIIAPPSPIYQVREKMLYAATKATVKKAFQSGVVIDDIAATTKVLTYKDIHCPPTHTHTLTSQGGTRVSSLFSWPNCL